MRRTPSLEKKVRQKHSVPLSDRSSCIRAASSDVTLKYRDASGLIRIDDDARLAISDDNGAFLQSHMLASDLMKRWERDELLFVLLEQVNGIVRLTVHFSSRANLQELHSKRPELRMDVYGLPPLSVAEVEPFSGPSSTTNELYEALYRQLESEDPTLCDRNADNFLRAPHIVVPLVSHLSSLSAEDSLKFPVHIKRLADQFRCILNFPESSIRIHKIEKNHLETWAAAQGKRYAFLDGGVARIAGIPGGEPTALRVGIYSVKPGDSDLLTREQWALRPYIVGDIIDKDTGVKMDEGDQMDLRRLGEAARYILEPLTGIRHVESAATDMLFCHGPLINQFVMYDEGKPHFLPFLSHEFLEAMRITRARLEEINGVIPRGPKGDPMWRQFMSVYGYIAQEISSATIPLVGVVERSVGRWMIKSVLLEAVDKKIVKEAYQRRVMDLVHKLNISDDFLFGCVLEEGEYLSPVLIPKNESHRARDHWQSVVARYPQPFATVLKASEMSFPFRVEMNGEAQRRAHEVLRLVFHTARLLPRYSFPVGLDIVDKYAKVPDWLSQGISARLAANVLHRAMAEGNARLIAQIRQLLAHTPRDFFYRPKI
jgi:hypothetical protein